MRKLNFTQKLTFGFSFIILLMMLFGLISYQRINNINEHVIKMYNHPLEVSKDIREVHISAIESKTILYNVLNSSEPIDSAKIYLKLYNHKKAINKNIEHLYHRYLGNMRDIDTLKNSCDALASLSHSIINSKINGLSPTQKKDFVNQIDSIINVFIKETNDIKLFATNKAIEIHSTSQLYVNKSQQFILYTLVGALLFTFLISYSLAQSIRVPVNRFFNRIILIIKNETVKNIDRRNHTEEELFKIFGNELHESFNENKSILQAALDTSPAGIVIAEAPSGKINYINKAALKIGGRKENELVTNVDKNNYYKKWHVYTTEGKKFRNEDMPIVKALNYGKITSAEMMIRWPDLSSRYLTVHAAPIKNDEGEIHSAIAIFTDITDQKNAELKLKNLNEQIEIQNEEYASINEEYQVINEELNQRNSELVDLNDKLEKAIKKASESDQLKSVFVSNMSHEIRTPLNAIMGFSEIIKESEDLDESLKVYLNYILQSGESLTQIIDDIIDISKIEAGQLQMKNAEIKLNDLLNDIYNIAKSNGKFKNKEAVDFKLNIPDAIKKLTFESDKVRIKQVIDNLLRNSIRFTEKGSIEMGCNLIVKDKEYLKFYVKDTGKGIPETKYNIIFERFRQADEDGYHEGNGLGLSICKGIIELMDGEIWFESEVDKGTTFYFTVPL